MNVRTITVRAVVPHYFAEANAPVHEIGAGFGSRQPGGRLARSIALSRCLHGLLNLRRSIKDLQLDFRSATGNVTPASSESSELKLEVVVVVHQDACLLDVIAPLVPQVQVLRHDLDDPRELGLVPLRALVLEQVQEPGPALGQQHSLMTPPAGPYDQLQSRFLLRLRSGQIPLLVSFLSSYSLSPNVPLRGERAYHNDTLIR